MYDEKICHNPQFSKASETLQYSFLLVQIKKILVN